MVSWMLAKDTRLLGHRQIILLLTAIAIGRGPAIMLATWAPLSTGQSRKIWVTPAHEMGLLQMETLILGNFHVLEWAVSKSAPSFWGKTISISQDCWLYYTSILEKTVQEKVVRSLFTKCEEPHLQETDWQLSPNAQYLAERSPVNFSCFCCW